MRRKRYTEVKHCTEVEVLLNKEIVRRLCLLLFKCRNCREAGSPCVCLLFTALADLDVDDDGDVDGSPIMTDPTVN
jgi:hypothetical protein